MFYRRILIFSWIVTSGVEYGNLRELVLARMRDYGTKCRDVRTREVGIQEVHHKVKPDQVELVRRDYVANGGWETFLAYEDPKQVLYPFKRKYLFVVLHRAVGYFDWFIASPQVFSCNI